MILAVPIAIVHLWNLWLLNCSVDFARSKYSSLCHNLFMGSSEMANGWQKRFCCALQVMGPHLRLLAASPSKRRQVSTASIALTRDQADEAARRSTALMLIDPLVRPRPVNGPE